MDLQPLTEAVLNKSLATLLAYPGDVSEMSRLPFWHPVASKAALQATIEERNQPTWVPPVEPYQLAVDLITEAVLALLSMDNIMDIDTLMKVWAYSGCAVFLLHLMPLIGENTGANGVRIFTPQQNTLMTSILDGITEHLLSKMPFTNDMACFEEGDDACQSDRSIVNDPKTWMVAATVQAETWLSENYDANIKDWIFPAEVVSLFINVGLKPWLNMCFVASYVRGPWNNQNRDDVSFYDSRYGKLLLYTTMFNGIQMLQRLNAGNSGVTSKLADLSSAFNILMQTTSDAEVGGDSMLDMYNKVASLSKDTKDRSSTIRAANAKLDTRKINANSIMVNSTTARQKMTDLKHGFWGWVVAYVVTVVIAIVLLVSGNHDQFIAQTGIVLTVVTLFLLATTIRRVMKG